MFFLRSYDGYFSCRKKWYIYFQYPQSVILLRPIMRSNGSKLCHGRTANDILCSCCCLWVLPFTILRLVREQINNGEIQTKAMKNNLKVGMERDLVKRFEFDLLKKRSDLATKILSRADHKDIQEPVMNFFEDVGFYLHRGYLDQEFVWHDFAFYSIHW
jgi:hypothetical protein